MISAVFTFAFITAVGEIIFLTYFPGFRAWLLRGNKRQLAFHTFIAGINLTIHWGTMTGSMTAVTAFIVSFIVLWIYQVIGRIKV